MKNIILAGLSAMLVALLTAAIWTFLPIRVATMAGADEEVAIIFFLVGPIAGGIVGGIAGFLVRIIRPGRHLWRRYLIFLGGALAVGVLFGVMWGDYRCTACF